MKNRNLLLFVVGLMALASCTPYEKVLYFQNEEALDTSRVVELYDSRIQPKDMLSIVVSSEIPEVVELFNMPESYLVDNSGCINFPTLGRIKISGLTSSEAELFIMEKLEKHFKNAPIVNVRMDNFEITVLGEVSRPNTYVVTNGKVNIFEAIAMAGDLTVYGKRDAVKLVRENADGTKQIIPIDLNEANLIYSPYYYLQQNDLLYVEPNRVKARGADFGSQTSLLFSVTSTAISLLHLFINLLR